MPPIGRSPKNVWQPPPDHIAIQTYISDEHHKILLQMAEKNERSMRAEARLILIQAIEAWKKANP